MATQILFKSACPSCEALIPIRDEGFIGKKVECPKCKYKFLVEEPEGFSSGDDGVTAKTKAKPKKKGKSNTPLLIGLGVGTTAIAVLAVVGYLVFGGGSGDTAKPNPSPRPIASTQPKDTEPSTTTSKTPDESSKQKSDTPATVEQPANNNAVAADIPAPGASGDITNLLPNDCRMVTLVNMDKLRFCTFGEQMFESKVGFKPDTFKEKIGIGQENMLQLVHGENPEQKWTFNVLRTNSPVDLKAMQKNLHFTKSQVINGRTWYELPQHDLLDNMSAALKPESELGARKNKSAGNMCVCQLDQTTVVFASKDPMEEFLKQNAKPRLQSKPSKKADDANTPAGGGAGEGPKPRGRGQSERFNLTTNEFLQAPDDAQLTDNATFLTIDPPLKAMLDRINDDPKVKPILVAALNVQSDPQMISRIRALAGGLPITSQGMRTFGVILTKYELEKFYGEVGADFFNENDVKALEAALKKQLGPIVRLLGLWLGGIKIDVEGADAVVEPNPGAANPGGAAPKGGGGQGSQGGIFIPGFTQAEEGPPSKVILKRKGHYIFVEAQMNLIQRAYDRIYGMTETIVAKMRGLVDMASPIPLWKEFTGALVKLGETGTVPRGTYQREETTGGRLVRNWPPSQRTSWMVGLLPHLGLDDLYRQIDYKKSWRDEKNLKAGSLIVPAFLDPRFPERTWHANLDSLGSRTQGATHYVGMAGIGLEAADYASNDPAVAKKLGVFGYERTTSMKDVTDGLSNTIFVIEVAPNYQRPWIAGGGATVMGAPEQKSVRPFVARQFKGTHVVMLDGSVRFISENISDEVFKALCTIKGGETIDDLEKIAPKASANKAQMKTETKDEEKEKEDKEKEEEKDKDKDKDGQ